MKAIQYDHSIRPYTTFKVDARSAQYVSVDSLSSLREALQSRPNGAIRILGGEVICSGEKIIGANHSHKPQRY